MESKKSFGQLLREARRASGKTLGDVARLLGKSVAYVSDVELDRRNPFSATDTFRICSYIEAEPAPLVELAARNRGRIEIKTQRQEVIQVAAAFARSSEKLTQKQLAKIRSVLEQGSDEE